MDLNKGRNTPLYYILYLFSGGRRASRDKKGFDTMKLINATTQTITLLNVNNEEVILEPAFDAQNAPYVKKSKVDTELYTDEGFVMLQTQYEVVSGNLPEPQEGVLYLVSQAVFNAFPERRDFVCSNDLVFIKGSRRPQGIRTLKCRDKVVEVPKTKAFTPAAAI